MGTALMALHLPAGLRGRALAAALVGALLLHTGPAGAGVAFTAVAAGDVSDSDVILWTRTVDEQTGSGVAAAVTAEIATDPGFQAPISLAGTSDAGRDFTLKLNAAGLRSNSRYYYRFRAADGATSMVGRFTTAPHADEKVAVTFAFSGDADGRFRPYPLVRDFAGLGLAYFVFLGDTMYESRSAGSPETADPFAEPERALLDYRRKYRENLEPMRPRGFAGLSAMFAAQANYTLLDNHELGNRQFQSGGAPAGSPPGRGVDPSDPRFDANTTGTFMNRTPGFSALLQAYGEYEPIRETRVAAPDDPRSDRTRRLYFAQRWGANSIFVNVDDRSYRDIRPMTALRRDDTGARADDPARTILGKTQLRWLEQTLLDAQAAGIPWKIVAVSSPIDELGAELDGGKSWAGAFRTERRELLKFIAENRIEHVVFLTTDDHFNRVNELSYLADPADPASRTRVPGAFTIVAGPLGAGGPDRYTDHSFAANLARANEMTSHAADGIRPLGLPPDFPGLGHVFREGDPAADQHREPVDFFSPDTFNYVVLAIAADGKTLSVETRGIDSYAADVFPEPDEIAPPRHILGFEIAIP
jgi:phosphodiesterase/alkaline phosphatase D-like protein